MVPSSRWMVYGVGLSVVSASEGSGIFWIVPFWGGDSKSSDNCTCTCIPGGNGSGVGSDLLRRRPHVRPPSYLIDFGNDVTGSLASSSLNAGGW